MQQYKFVESAKSKRTRRSKSFQFKGGTNKISTEEKRKKAKEIRTTLSDCLIFLVEEWQQCEISFEKAKQQVLACIEQAEAEGANSTEMRRMKLNINGDGEREGITDIDELIKYVYNFHLGASGLSINRILRGK